MPLIEDPNEEYRSEMQEIISAPPPWIVRWGMSLFFLILVMLVGIAALIRYPDIVKAQLKINSENAPKPVIAKVSGKLVKVLIKDSEFVKSGQALAYLESTGNHRKILEILGHLKSIQNKFYKNERLSMEFLNTPETFELGELQGSYQSFYQSFLNYNSAILDGIYLKKRNYLQKDLQSIIAQRSYILSQKKIREKEFALAKEEYEMHKQLFEQKVEARMEFKREEAKFLSSQHPLEQTRSSILNIENTYTAKEKEIIELDNQINEAKSTFLQALNNQISEIENWKSKYVLTTSQTGRVVYAGILQENQIVDANQELFYINPGNTDFFGIVHIPQYSMGKVETGQEVLIKLKSFPYEEYGIIHGKVASITEVPFQDTIFISRISFNMKDAKLRRPVYLKTGMTADAEIITQDASLLKRLMKNVIKIIE